MSNTISESRPPIDLLASNRQDRSAGSKSLQLGNTSSLLLGSASGSPNQGLFEQLLQLPQSSREPAANKPDSPRPERAHSDDSPDKPAGPDEGRGESKTEDSVSNDTELENASDLTAILLPDPIAQAATVAVAVVQPTVELAVDGATTTLETPQLVQSQTTTLNTDVATNETQSVLNASGEVAVDTGDTTLAGQPIEGTVETTGQPAAESGLETQVNVEQESVQVASSTETNSTLTETQAELPDQAIQASSDSPASSDQGDQGQSETAELTLEGDLSEGAEIDEEEPEKWFQKSPGFEPAGAGPADYAAPESPSTASDLSNSASPGIDSTETAPSAVEPPSPSEPTGPQATSPPASASAASAAASSVPTAEASSLTTRTNESTSIQPVSGSGTTRSPSRSTSSPNPQAANESSNITQHERVRLIQRVSRSFSRLGPAGGEIQLKLHPPQLGSLAMKVQMEGRTMTARLSVESHAAREVIMEGLPVLKQRLAEQGIEVALFQVEVADSGQDTSTSSFSQDSARQDSDSSQRQARYQQAIGRDGQNSAANSIPEQVTTAALAWASDSGIDVQA